MSCYFCDEIAGREQCPIGDRIIWQNDDFMIIPTVGCFTPGYVMLMPKDHSFSIGQLDEEDLHQVVVLAEKIRRIIGEVYQQPIFMAEHGALDCANKGAQCCDHAHLHFIPARDDDTISQIASTYCRASLLSPKLLNEISELEDFSHIPYIFASFDPYVYQVWDTELKNFRSQFCRWAAAKCLGVEAEYSWKTHPHWENMRSTIEKLKGKIRF